MWRLASNVFSTMIHLNRKGLSLDISNPLYHKKNETVHHIFMYCDVVSLLLFTSQFGAHIPIETELNGWIL